MDTGGTLQPTWIKQDEIRIHFDCIKSRNKIKLQLMCWVIKNKLNVFQLSGLSVLKHNCVCISVNQIQNKLCIHQSKMLCKMQFLIDLDRYLLWAEPCRDTVQADETKTKVIELRLTRKRFCFCYFHQTRKKIFITFFCGK